LGNVRAGIHIRILILWVHKHVLPNAEPGHMLAR